MKKRSIITIVALVGVAVAFFLILENNKSRNQAELAIVAQSNSEVAVRVATVATEAISGQFSVNGTFLPATQAQVSAELGGQLVAIYVEEGDRVKAGQVIARLSGDKIDVNVGNAKAVLDNAEATLQRYEAAHRTGGVTAVQLDQARLQVENAKANYESARLNSGDTSIRSKVDGIVNRKMVEVGSVVGPGTPIVEIVNIASLKLRVEVDEAVVSQLEKGSSVRVLPSATADTLDGSIGFIAPSSNGALKFPVEVLIDNQDGKLRAGMYATAVFSREGAQEALIIPREAFVGSVSDNKVFVIENGQARLTDIQSGVNYGDKVEVLAGLKAGDRVVVSGQINLLDGTVVRVLE